MRVTNIARQQEREMIDITVQVPEDRHAEFHAMYAAWLDAPQSSVQSGAVGDQRNTAPHNISLSGSDNDRREPWSAADATLAANLWDKFSDQAKALFSKLIDEPDRQFTG